jgi:predicted nucleotide-binding protein
MIERYEGENGRRLLIEALRAQPFVEGNSEIATLLADACILEEVVAGQRLMEQGGSDNSIVLVVSGTAAIYVNGRVVARRRTGQHVGEMALIDVSAKRSATVIAEETTVVARVLEHRFASVADRFPRVWRLLAVEISKRLRERGDHIKPPNDKPHVFIGSSREALQVAGTIEAGLAGNGFVVRVWTNGVFGASKTAIEALEEMVKAFDFAVLVFSNDDKVFSRGEEFAAPRDNVIFELGLAMGALERKRSFIVMPHGSDLKIPTDLLGITPLKYAPSQSPSLAERLAPACAELTEMILQLGPK